MQALTICYFVGILLQNDAKTNFIKLHADKKMRRIFSGVKGKSNHTECTLFAKTTVLKIFSGARTIDKEIQHSSQKLTTTYGLRFFADFWNSIQSYCMLHRDVWFYW
jgi:hypothetical protein